MTCVPWCLIPVRVTCRQRVREHFAGLQLPEDLAACQCVNYTLLLRQRDGLDGLDRSRPIKLRVGWLVVSSPARSVPPAESVSAAGLSSCSLFLQFFFHSVTVF